MFWDHEVLSCVDQKHGEQIFVFFSLCSLYERAYKPNSVSSFFFLQPCNNVECLYLHEIGFQEDSFTKDETISVHMR